VCRTELSRGTREGHGNPFPRHPRLLQHRTHWKLLGSCHGAPAGLGLARGGQELLGLSCRQTVARVALDAHKTESQGGWPAAWSSRPQGSQCWR